MVIVELTKREADAITKAIKLGDTDDPEALRNATGKLWKAAEAQRHGGTWRIICAAERTSSDEHDDDPPQEHTMVETARTTLDEDTALTWPLLC